MVAQSDSINRLSFEINIYYQIFIFKSLALVEKTKQAIQKYEKQTGQRDVITSV